MLSTVDNEQISYRTMRYCRNNYIRSKFYKNLKRKTPANVSIKDRSKSNSYLKRTHHIIPLRYNYSPHPITVPIVSGIKSYYDEADLDEIMYNLECWEERIRYYYYLNKIDNGKKEREQFHKEEKEEMSKYYCDDDTRETRETNQLKRYLMLSGNKMKGRLLSSGKRLINFDAMYDTAERWLVDKVKTHFGKEFKLHNCSNMKESIHLKEFLSKYDKNFDKHLNGKTLCDFTTICYLEAGTFMYIATGRMVPAKMDYAFMNKETEDVYIYIFGHSAPKYWKELEDVMNKDSTKDKGGLIFNISKVSSGSYNITSMDLHKRGFDKLYFSNGEIDAVKKHLDKFMETYEMYNSKQLSYKTGILLYGDPGTGKTSLAKAIASEYNRSICAITVSSIADIDFAELATMINNDIVDTYVVLFEDIDTIDNALQTRRKSKKKNDDYDEDDEEEKPKKSRSDIMNALMQFLDGVNSPNNVIFVATTNYVDRLDEAFIRAGRFDLKIEVKPLNLKEAIEFAKSFELSDAEVEKALEEYSKTYPEERYYNQAKLQGVIIKYIK